MVSSFEPSQVDFPVYVNSERNSASVNPARRIWLRSKNGATERCMGITRLGRPILASTTWLPF